MTRGPGKRRGPRTAAELMAELERDPAYVEARTQRDEEHRRRVEASRTAARGVLADLAAVGFRVDAISDLVHARRPYPEAVPVLLRWLAEVRDHAVREEIVRTLSVPWASAAVPALVSEYERAWDGDAPGGRGLRWVIGNALEVLASDASAEALLRIAGDRRYGRDREMVVLGLGKLRDPRAVPALIALLDDEDVVGHAVVALGRLRASEARARIGALVRHEKAWIRAEARKALARIEGR